MLAPGKDRDEQLGKPELSLSLGHSSSKIQSVLRGVYLVDCDRSDRRFSSLRPTGNQNYCAAIYPITVL